MLYRLTDIEIQHIREDPDNQDWKAICYSYYLSEDFITEFLDRFVCTIFGTLITYQKITESFIFSIKDRLSESNWRTISFIENLSEDFIREFQDKLSWVWISKYQKFSKEFIIEFSDKIVFTQLLLNENISDEVKQFCRMFI